MRYLFNALFIAFTFENTRQNIKSLTLIIAIINKRQLHSLQTNLQKRFRNNLSIVFQIYDVICNASSVLQFHIQEFSEGKRTQRTKSMKLMKMRTNHYRNTA